MARRIPLPRLSRRQRLARWQRERRQQVVYLGIFTTILFFALGLVGWAAASRYYDENLKPAASIAGRSVPMRDFNRRLLFEKTRFFVEAGVPEGRENDPQLSRQVAQLRRGALDELVLGELLGDVAREEGALPSPQELQARVDRDFGEVHARHILIKPDEKVTDKQKADAEAKDKAAKLAAQLRTDPKNDQMWKDLAAKESADPGSKDAGGDLGWVSASSGFVKEFEDAMYALSDGEISEPVKSTFGYHVIQRIESRSAQRTALYSRLRKAGVSTDDLLSVARASLLKDLYEKRIHDAEIPSPQPQVHLATIVVRLPPPSQTDAYLEAQRKVNAVIKGLNQGQDFAALAREQSDDPDTREKGGDMGWVTAAMLPLDEAKRPSIAADVFSRAVGERSDQHLVRGDLAIYQVLEKDPARPLTEEQRAQIRDQAFPLWLAKQEERLAVQRLIPGLEF